MLARRLALVAVVLATACGSKAPKPPEKPVKPDVVTPPVAKPKTAAEVFLIDCRANLDTGKKILADLQAAAGERSVDNTLVPLNALYVELANAAAKAGLYSEVHPDPEVQAAARTCEQEASAF